jgi:hypothetical protein
MKQAKKYWAWTARQRGRCYRRSIRRPAPPPDFRRYHWHQHRTRTRHVLHLVSEGHDEGHLTLFYQPRHGARYDWE